MDEAASSAVPAPLLRGLPDEISIWEILLRLPPKALLRCRAVCGGWRSATSSHDFLLDHHGRQPTLSLLEGYDDDDDGLLDIIHFDHRTGLAAADQLQSVARLATPPWTLNPPIYCMEASCDGLLVLSMSFKDFSICNPATREYAPLPMLREFKLLGMYPHSPTGEYRLLLKKPADFMHDKLSCHVFTIGSQQLPRRIESPDLGRMLPDIRVPVLLHGCLHWHKDQMILVFDTAVESFRHMRSPDVSGDIGLFEIDGMLGMCSPKNKETIMDIWVMQDYEGEVWSFKHRVELPVAQLVVQFGEFDGGLIVVVPSGDGDVLVLVKFGDWLHQIGTDGKLIVSFPRRALGALCLPEVRLKQTLVPHTFFLALEGYVVNAWPFI